jgi:chaperonin GroES
MSSGGKNKKPTITPLGDRVLVKPLEKETKTASGIIIPDTVSKEKPDQGKVIAIGAGKINDAGTLIPLSVKKGDTVIFSKYSPDEVTVAGEAYYIISESSILAVIK